MKIYSAFSVLLCILCLLPACKKNQGDVPATLPTISGIQPASGPINTPVTVTGSNFGTDASKVTVLFNGVRATVQSVTDTQVVALSPVIGTSGIIKIIVNALSVDGPVFTYDKGVVVTTITGVTSGVLRMAPGAQHNSINQSASL